MNNRHITVRANIWRFLLALFVLWLVFFRPDILAGLDIQRLLPDVSQMNDLQAITTYAMLGIVIVAIVKLLTQSR